MSSLRIKGSVYQPMVVHAGKYKIDVGEGEESKRYFDIEAIQKNQETITVGL